MSKLYTSDRLVSLREEHVTVRNHKVIDLVRDWWQFEVLVAYIALVPTLIGGSSYFFFLTVGGIWAIAVVGVSMLAGMAGQYSLGQAGICAIGAYSSGMAATRWGLPALAGIGIGVAVAVLLAAATSPILRLRGWYLGAATLVLGLVLQDIPNNLNSLGGENGIYGIPGLTLFGLKLQGATAMFVVSWGLVAVLLALSRNITRSRYGQAMGAIHRDENVARTLGLPSSRYKAYIWMLAAIPAAISGSLYAYYSSYISSTGFGLSQSIFLLVAVLLGGEESGFGALVGLVILETVSDVDKSQVIDPNLVTGIILIVFYLLSPAGLSGIGRRAISGVKERRDRRFGRDLDAGRALVGVNDADHL